MTTTFDVIGPVVPVDSHNTILRDALLKTASARGPSVTDYHVIKIGVREGEFTTWVGEWTQVSQKVAASVPVSVLYPERLGMRLKAGWALVARVAATGAPTAIRGSSITFRMALVGGRDGPAKALVTGSAGISDANQRSAVALMERQINTGGLAQWDETLDLVDPPTTPGPVSRLPYVTPSQLTANQNNYNPTGLSSAAVLRLSSDASRNITGIYGGAEGREIVILNVGSQNVVLKNADAGSDAANRFSIGADITLAGGGQGVVIWYDAVTSTWRAR